MDKYYSIDLNDSIQWIQIIGNIENPILLTLHGGPGTPCMSLFKKYNAKLLDKYCLVLWDQRGTGRSYTNSLSEEKMSYEQILKDGHDLTQLLKDEYQKDKIYLLGHSFGATVGLKLASLYPEDYYSYFGVSQFIDATKNEKYCYDMIKKEAIIRDDKKALSLLKKVGEPVDGFYLGGLKSTMKVKQLVTKYKGDNRSGMSQLQLILSLFLSKEYGFNHFLKAIKGIPFSLNAIGSSLKGIDYIKTIPKLKIPVYFFSGKYDMLTPQTILNDYVDVLDAPIKKVFTFEESSHSPLWEESEKFNALLLGLELFSDES